MEDSFFNISTLPSNWTTNTTTDPLTTTMLSTFRNHSNHYKASSGFSRAIIHYTFYELNFLDIIFIAVVFLLKFFITSLFLIFALVAINGNSYPQLLARSAESHRLSTGPYSTRRRDLIYTLAALNIISGNLDFLLNYISAIQRFLFITSCSAKWSQIQSLWRRWILCLQATRRSSSSDAASVRLPLNGTTGTAPKIADSGRLTPRVVFIDSEPGLLEEEEDEGGQQQSVTSSLNATPVDYVPVLRLRILNTQDGTSLIARARLDPHSICSYISPEIAANLRLRRHFIWPVFFRSFPGRFVKYVYQATSVVLQSTEETEEGGGLVATEPVELLIPTKSSFGPSARPSSWITFLAKNTCSIQLSDEDQEDADAEIGLVIGQDLLYKYFLSKEHPHKAFIIGSSLTFIKTAFGWCTSGTTAGLSVGGDVKIWQVETANLGIAEKEFGRKHKCTDTMRILCCPLQILVSLLVLLIYIIIPYIDSLLYLYNILFHLAITFALAQILAFILGPLWTLVQSLIAWRLTITIHLLRVNILAAYQLLSKPLLALYIWFLGAIWVSLYWFLSMGKALFNQWNYSTLEDKWSIRFSGHWRVQALGPYPEDNQTVIRVKMDPVAEISTISADLTTSEGFRKLFSEVETSPRTLEHGVNGEQGRTQDSGSFTIRLSPEKEVTFKVIEPEVGDLTQQSSITIGADLLEATSDPALNRLLRSVLLFDTHIPGRPIEVCLENAEEPGGPWALEHRFYPHGWLQIISCTYWFTRPNLLYLFFFIGYSFLLAVVYFCLLAPYELTLISIHPTMFRYIGNFLFYNAHWR